MPQLFLIVLLKKSTFDEDYWRKINDLQTLSTLPDLRMSERFIGDYIPLARFRGLSTRTRVSWHSAKKLAHVRTFLHTFAILPTQETGSGTMHPLLPTVAKARGEIDHFY